MHTPTKQSTGKIAKTMGAAKVMPKGKGPRLKLSRVLACLAERWSQACPPSSLKPGLVVHSCIVIKRVRSLRSSLTT